MGREVARQLAEKGANVIISARTERDLIEAVAYIKVWSVGSILQTIDYHHRLEHDKHNTSLTLPEMLAIPTFQWSCWQRPPTEMPAVLRISYGVVPA